MQLFTEVLTAERVCGNKLGPGAHGGVLWLGGQRTEGNKFIGYDLRPDQFADLAQVWSRDTDQESDWVTDVAQKQLKRQVWLAVLGDIDIAVQEG